MRRPANDRALQNRSTETTKEQVRKLIPLAEKLNVIIGLENVWNNLRVQPDLYRMYLVASFNHPFAQADDDVGNHVKDLLRVHDWIHTLGGLIKKIHIKDYALAPDNHSGKFVHPRDGSIDWPKRARRSKTSVTTAGSRSRTTGCRCRNSWIAWIRSSPAFNAVGIPDSIPSGSFRSRYARGTAITSTVISLPVRVIAPRKVAGPVFIMGADVQGLELHLHRVIRVPVYGPVETYSLASFAAVRESDADH